MIHQMNVRRVVHTDSFMNPVKQVLIITGY